MLFRRNRRGNHPQNLVNGGTDTHRRGHFVLMVRIVVGGVVLLGLPATYMLSNNLFNDAFTTGLVVLDLPSASEIGRGIGVLFPADEFETVEDEATHQTPRPVIAPPDDELVATTASDTSQAEVKVAKEAADTVVEETPMQMMPPEGGGERDATTTATADGTTKPAIDASISDVDDKDKDCPFRNSPIYRKVFVYPTYGEVENGWSGDILSDAGRNLATLPRWPWLDLDEKARKGGFAHYNRKGVNVQYATELLVREIMVNPKSCLRTDDPEEATLFYVPYLPSIEFHEGSDRALNYTTSPYGKAILDLIDNGQYSAWENLYGLTSKYWKRRNGTDHILVFSEPMHGLYHPRSKRGNYHFIRTQKQLAPPIVISVELSTTFIDTYPKCAAKNILMPYPNTDGDWFNGKNKGEAEQLLKKAGLQAINSTAALPAERQLAAATGSPAARVVAQYYSAGAHGTCTQLRRSMKKDYVGCAPSYTMLNNQLQVKYYGVGMQLATFCPCPGGDSPSAKRHFDAILADCIPIILSYDYVWPFTKEFDPTIDWDPNDFSIRLNASEYTEPLLDPTTCQPLNATKSTGLQKYLESIPALELERLRRGMVKAKYMYSWYTPDASVVDNPLQERVLPDGGVAHTLVAMLAERAAGAMWPACEAELKTPRPPDQWQFIC